MKIIVGSKNAAKVKAVQMGVSAYWPEASVEGHDVASGVRAQPLGGQETMTGALNRARAAKALGGDFGVGLEGGMDEIHGQPVMISYLAVTDGMREVVVPVTGVPMPRPWGEALKNGAELRPLVIELGLPYRHETGVIGTLTNDQMSRDEMFSYAVKTAFVPWVNPAAFAESATAA